MNHVASWSYFEEVCQGSYFFLGLHPDELSHRYNTRSNQLKKMDLLEQENHELCEVVTTLRENYERLTSMMTALVAAQNHPHTSPYTLL